LLKTKFNRVFFYRMVSNIQKNSQLFLKKFFSQELSNYAFEGFICRQENATAVLEGILDFDSFLSTAALITHLIFSVGGGEKSSKSNQNRKRSSLESSFRSELLFRDHSHYERFTFTEVFCTCHRTQVPSGLSFWRTQYYTVLISSPSNVEYSCA